MRKPGRKLAGANVRSTISADTNGAACGWERPDCGLGKRRRAIGETDRRRCLISDPLGGAGSLSGTERLLWESAERGAKHHHDLVVLILHLSRLTPPAPRPHHIRIARVLLQDTATRHGGQVFAMRNHDLVLLAQAGVTQEGGFAGDTGGLVVHTPEVLPDTLARLFSADVPTDCQLTSLHRMDSASAAVRDYLAGCAALPVLAAPGVQQHDPVRSLCALQSVLELAPLNELLMLRTGMRLRPDRHLSIAERLVPAFRSIQFSFSALNLNPLVSCAMSDPFLLRHFAAGLDERLIGLLWDDVATGGGLTRQAVLTGIPVHVELGLQAILSPDYARLACRAADIGLRFGVAMPLMQVCADLDRFELAKRVLSMTGGELVITGLQPGQMDLINPKCLSNSLVKLTWSTSLIEDAAAWDAGKLRLLDPECIALLGVDSQQAVAWGRAHGIAFYEGAFLDQVQAAHRMEECEHAPACTLRQCCDRARAIGQWGRAGCRNPALLDARFAPARKTKQAA